MTSTRDDQPRADPGRDPEPGGAYPPPAQFAAGANVTGAGLPGGGSAPEFWAEQARSRLSWSRPFTEVLDDSGLPYVRWFADGRLNAAYNAVDRHVEEGRGARVAYHFVGEPGDTRTVRYADLQEQTSRAANVLTALGVRRGDRVAIYLPMIPEAVVAMLACARIGAVHSVIFGGFSADAVRSRVADAGACVVITADGGYRRGPVALKPAVDAALRAGLPSVRHVLVVRRTEQPVDWHPGRDLWWHEALASASPVHRPVEMAAEDPLFLLYTSGTTGRPKGIVHSTGGYLAQSAWTHHAVFDLKDTDVYWCTADLGWITGHTMAVYGPLTNGATQVLYEGAPDGGRPDRWWEIIATYGVTVFFTAPAAVRWAMQRGAQHPGAHDLSTIRLLGTAGETIEPRTWRWYRDVIGAGRVPVVDTWWQTETGAPMISALPGVTSLKPGAAQVPLPGIEVGVVDETGAEVDRGGHGRLVVLAPWPAMLRGIWGDDERFRRTYWDPARPGVYRTGDNARRDGDGDIWLTGRADDVLNVSGHRLSSVEIEEVLTAHPSVGEAAVVGVPDELTGQAVVAFVVLAGAWADGTSDGIETALRAHVAEHIGAFARPRSVVVVPELVRTRSQKVVRRLLREIAEDRELGDTSTVADVEALERVAAGVRRASATRSR